jgi:predicted HicB family RNase H-like nuclease
MKSVNTRYPDEVHEQVKVTSEEDHRSFNSQVIDLIERGLEARQRERTARTAKPDTEETQP